MQQNAPFQGLATGIPVSLLLWMCVISAVMTFMAD